MKAVQISGYGDVSVIGFNEIDKPVVGQGQVLVEVHAASVNPFDTKVRLGYMKDMMPLKFPVTIGGDFAGVAVEVGSGVTNIAVGDRVYGQANTGFGYGGSIAEFVATSAGQTAKTPNNVDFNEAASLPLVGASALQALVEHLELKAGDNILITGGSGGIGTMAIQIAKHLGARVSATASGAGLQVAKQLGADVVYDYASDGLLKLPKDFDAVFDTVGGEVFSAVLASVKTGGKIVTMGQGDLSRAEELGVTAIGQYTRVTSEVLDTLRELVEGGVVKSQVNSVFSLSDTAKAFETKETSKVAGKVVIEIVQ
ncbi:MAG: NADP-dependent oxidoreductase [Candidatus Saccharimonas sp.]